MKWVMSFKEDIKVRDLMLLTEKCRMLLVAFMEYCQDKNLPCMVTSLVNDRGEVRAKTKVHATGRAFDVSIKGWSSEQIEHCENYFNKAYKNIAAISLADGQPRAAIAHDSGWGPHIHFQVRPDGT